jgi:hypothetical protein
MAENVIPKNKGYFELKKNIGSKKSSLTSSFLPESKRKNSHVKDVLYTRKKEFLSPEVGKKG